jgi:hypothetical protein
VLDLHNAVRYYRRKNMVAARKVVVPFFWAVCLAMLGSTAAHAQITIKNPKHLPLPDYKLQALYRIACEQVAEEFHISDPAKLDFPLTVVLGEPSHYTSDDDKQSYVIYLDRWDDIRFTSSVVLLAAHRVVSRERYKRMVLETLRRANEIMPIQAADLQKQH